MDFNRNLRIVRTSGPSYPFPYKSNVLWVHHDENNNPVVEIWDHGKWSPVTGVRSDSGDVIIDTEMSDSSSNAIANKTVKKYVDGIASKTDASILYLNEGVSALKTLTEGHTKSIEDLGIAKQDALVSGTNIKTINSQSLLGSGNISIEETVDSELSLTSENPVQNKVVTKALQTKADISVIPIKVSQLENDSKFATQEAVVQGLATKADKDSLTSLESDITSLQTTVENQDRSIIANAQAIQNKQDKLVSGTNIKTINNQSILGSGNISIEGGGSTIVVDDALSNTSENPVQNKVITTKLNSLETSLGSKASQTDLDNLSSTVTTQGQTITSIQTEIGNINTQLTEING